MFDWILNTPLELREKARTECKVVKMLSKPLPSLVVRFEQISLLFLGIQLLNLDMYLVTGI